MSNPHSLQAKFLMVTLGLLSVHAWQHCPAPPMCWIIFQQAEAIRQVGGKSVAM